MSHRTRIRSALWMIPLTVAAILYLPTPYFAALVALVILAGLYEWTHLAGLQKPISKLLYLCINALLMLGIAWSHSVNANSFFIASLIGSGFWLLSILWLWKHTFAKHASRSQRNFKLLVGSLACIPAWSAITWIHGSAQGSAWTLLAIGLIAAADSGAYVFGVNFGKRKLAPRISPGKSWEGFWGGLLCSIALAILCRHYFTTTHASWLSFALLGAGTAVFSVIGDLIESLLKRHAQVKDSSTLIPGHGGLLDRLDSIVSGFTVFALLKFWLMA